MKPTEVTIVRPDAGLTDFISGAISFALRAWVGMLAIGALFPEAGVSYGQAVLGLFVIGAVNPSDYIFWTKSPGWKP